MFESSRDHERAISAGKSLSEPLTNRSSMLPPGPVHGDLYLKPEPRVDSIQYWNLIFRFKRVVILAGLAGLIATALATSREKPFYQARASLEIQNLNDDFLNSRRVNPLAEDSSDARLSTDIPTQIKILQSETLLDRVIARLRRIDDLEALRQDSGIFATLKKVFPSLRAAGSNTDLRQKALENLTVRQIGQTRMIEVLYTSTSPRFAAEFVNTLASEYIESNMEARWKMSEYTGNWLARQLDGMRSTLEASEKALESYAQRSRLLFTAPASGSSEKSNISEEKLRQTQEGVSRAQLDRAVAEARYQTAKSASADTLADVLDDESLQDLQGKLIDLKRQEADLITTYTPKHEKVTRIQAQIAPLEAAVNSKRNAIVQRIQNDYQTALRREKLLETEYAEQVRVVTDQANKSVEYNILKREVDSNRQIYDAMLQQVKQASVASTIRASNARVVDAAEVPSDPSGPNMPLNAVAGLLGGMLLSVGFVVLRRGMDRTVQGPGDMRIYTNVPELGVIPSTSIGRGVSFRKGWNFKTKPTLSLRDGEQLPVNECFRSVELSSWWSKPGLVSESFRNVQTSIMRAGENGSRPRVIVFTSANPLDGKTTVVSNLAIAMAEVGQKVLIIDADLRKPRMHELFGLSNVSGLSNLLADESSGNALLDTFVQKTSVPGLHILPSGPTTAASAKLFHSAVLGDLLANLKLRFDIVLIDTPPVLHVSDARVIAPWADAAILVARAGQTNRDAAFFAHQRLKEDRVRILGTILNDWNPRKSASSYYTYHNDRYHQREP